MTHWQWANFHELGVDGLYAVLALRSAVFVNEQQCVYHDIDGLDRGALHLLGWQPVADASQADGDQRLAAYLRVLAPGVRYTEPSIGRVITAPFARAHGTGKLLMGTAIAKVRTLYPGQAVRISAQLYLERFYGELGFARASEPYDEDGIMHVEMLLAPA